MKRKTLVLGVVGLALLWVVVFGLASLFINNTNDTNGVPNNARIESLPTATPRNDTPSLTPSATAEATATTQVEAPVQIEGDAEATADVEITAEIEADAEATADATATRQPVPDFSLPGLDLNAVQEQHEAENESLAEIIEAPPTIEVPVDPDSGSYPIRLAIEDLNILSSVVAVQTDDEFNIVTPREEVGYYALTDKIGAGGNTVMVGHVYPGRVFNNLLEAEVDQIIRITDERYNEHYYRVTEVRRLPYEIGDERDREIGFEYMYDDSEERLTLVTCYPEFEWTHRFVVRAVPIPAPEANPDTGEGVADAD